MTRWYIYECSEESEYNEFLDFIKDTDGLSLASIEDKSSGWSKCYICLNPPEGFGPVAVLKDQRVYKMMTNIKLIDDPEDAKKHLLAINSLEGLIIRNGGPVDRVGHLKETIGHLMSDLKSIDEDEYRLLMKSLE